ncbi:hypothetical protein DFR49_3402 [Hephaestia caeni]|uniref:LuxR family transcriptional regulator n=1 Tax=Hephaestia caeni TaxID=645617 RepID=A0A397NJ06_9SPHN|nr:hypothetical protein [Hephaestia caeni]RIA37516.1 hypothetical protein DFR49_3402 [Hephaestia caeni]
MMHKRPEPKAASRRIAVAALIAGLALAQSGYAAAHEMASGPRLEGLAPSAAAGQSPFLGKWELDLARMPDTYGPAPKRVTFAFEDVGAGRWRTVIEITAPNGSVRQAASEYRRDGKAVRAEGDTAEADSAAFSSPAPDVLVMSLAKDKGLASVRVYTISADGKEMTESAADTDGDGAPFVRTFHFKRIA